MSIEISNTPSGPGSLWQPPEIAAAASAVKGSGEAGAVRIEVEEDPAGALARAREIAGEDGLVVATGSLYLVGRLLPLF